MSQLLPIYKTTLFRLSVGSGILLILVRVFQSDIIDVVTPFLMIFIQGPVTGFYFVTLVWSFIYPFLKFKQYRYWSLLPLVINITVMLIMVLVPFTKIAINYDFSSKLKIRSEVVEKIRSGELLNNVDYNKSLIRLPSNFPNVSKGGNEILFEKTNDKLKVFFFTFRGVIDNYSGFIYKEDNTPPTAEDFGCGDMLNSKKFQDNWFWMACT